MPEREPSWLREGDFLLLTAPPVWTLGSSRDVVPVDFVRGQPRAGVMQWTLGSDGSGPVTRLIGGHFWFDDANAPLLDGLLPDVVEIRSSNTDASRPARRARSHRR